MTYWWVNQNQTYVHEVNGGYLWSPKTKANGERNHFYDTMTQVAPGDVIFSFADTHIKAIGIAREVHQSASKPVEFGSAGANWTDEGWYVPVDFIELANPIRPKDHMDRLAPLLPSKYSPLQENGNGNQGVYLASVPDDLAHELEAILDGQVQSILANKSNTAETDDSINIDRLLSDGALPATQRTQLIQARIGQGLFRSRVAALEPCCRITGIIDPRFLIASHIKPWSKSNNIEKLDGHNGLLLAPHIDRLFDKGYMTFENDGLLRFSPQLPTEIYRAWSLDASITAKPFSRQQEDYMAYHRAEVFLDDMTNR
ncbi:MAG: HNH endonuclease [Advenella sp.]|uniref:HNH endonuclease n=1 Tax=Advenella kashmirensis TaxID=310575 RepID=A0A356LB46_9BURK|nr:HNH endonuclease signature motif containing protein [Advenella sp. FME57]HBP28039.1 HNH endonuclease [Advenella kashmirensis]